MVLCSVVVVVCVVGSFCSTVVQLEVKQMPQTDRKVRIMDFIRSHVTAEQSQLPWGVTLLR